jgi:phenylacetate-coenzyme A ligase PaaK-like adenylate-forming protein
MSTATAEYQNLKSKIFELDSAEAFKSTALEVFYFQYKHIPVYRQWVDYLNTDPQTISSLHEIPFLPIRFFKEHKIIRQGSAAEIIFSSSGTTGMQRSRHFVADLDLYRTTFRRAFRYFYAPVDEYVVLALLPSYLEREGSSLIYMAEDMIRRSGHHESGFYLNEHRELYEMLQQLKAARKKVLLLGVSFGLLDFAEQYKIDFPELIVMETGGMKGRRKEMVREELHKIYRDSFGVEQIHSEYGMTELMSQAYSKGEGRFHTPPWMRITIRDPNDPLSPVAQGRSGGVNIIDLANLNSCAFIATQDVGKLLPDGGFEILGRFDHSDVRGCNLLVV